MNKLFTFMRESSTARFLIPAGIVLIAFGIVMFIINSKNQNYVDIEAVVSNIAESQAAYVDEEGNPVEATYTATVKYTVDGNDYEGKLDNVSKYNVGDKIKIYYNPQDPSQITQTKSLILPIVLIAGGVAAFAGGIVSGVNAYKRYKKMKEQEKGWENGK